MIEYRSFRNTDPPQLVALWQGAGLGRGAALDLGTDVFEDVCFSQPYFDPQGLIVACDGDRVVGFAHAGFGATPEGSSLSKQAGVICAVIVAPEYRRQGIGRELVDKVERYLRTAGSTSITAGPATGRDPFYVGIYGGTQPSGFLESDPAAHPFFLALGYQPSQRWIVYQRDLAAANDPMSMRLLSIRRAADLAATDHPQPLTWWWTTRYGRLDTVRFLLVLKDENRIAATMNIVGLDFYASKWQERAVGFTDLSVPSDDRRKGYGQAMLVEVCRKLREEMVTRVEMHARETDLPLTGLLHSCDFAPVDVGLVYQRPAR